MVGTILLSNCTYNWKTNSEGDTSMANYNPKNNTYINNYKKEHYKCLQVEVRKEFYTDVLVPAAKEKGMAVATYVKEAINEKLERESKG